MGASYGSRDFLLSEKALELRSELQAMVADPLYNTQLRYSIDTPDGSHFVEKHMKYMSNHLQMNHGQYIANLRLMTKVSTLGK